MQKILTIEDSSKDTVVAILAGMGVTPSKQESANGMTELTVELTDAQIQALNEAFGNDATIGMMIRDGVNAVAGVVTDAADFAVNDLAIPVATIGVKAGASLLRITGKAVAYAGASVINNLVDEGVRTVNDVQKNDECQKLKQSWATVKGVFSKKQPKFKIS